VGVISHVGLGFAGTRNTELQIQILEIKSVYVRYGEVRVLHNNLANACNSPR
jgi:hypothetical protein